jgi:hypothetical protein
MFLHSLEFWGKIYFPLASKLIGTLNFLAPRAILDVSTFSSTLLFCKMSDMFTNDRI